MPNPRIRFLIPILLGVGLLAGFFLLLPTREANAQCGSQASSCKNCHEVQGQDPVNNDGTTWHTSHAFGDFCYICHAGNNQSTDKTEAHAGMVSPLLDIKASCMQCHPNDYQQKAQIYATTLGVTIVEVNTSPINTSATTPITQTTSTSMTQTNNTTATNCPQIGTQLSINDPNLVDFKQTYNEVVLGKKPINWGNIILLGMICMMVVGGGGFILKNEKLVKVSFGETKTMQAEYPADVVDMLPDISRVSSSSRKTLSNVLKNPKKAEKVFGLMEAVISDEKSED
jgi:hypothetical protein